MKSYLLSENRPTFLPPFSKWTPPCITADRSAQTDAAKTAHLFPSAAGWKPSCQIPATPVSSLCSSFSPLASQTLLSSVCTWAVRPPSLPAYSSIPDDTTCLPPPWQTHASPVGLVPLKPFTNLPPCSSNLHLAHLRFPCHSLLSLPLPNSASTQLLPIFHCPLFTISPSSSPSSQPSTLHRCHCLSSLYILSLRFAFSPSLAAWIYYYPHNGPCLLFMNYQPCSQTKPIFIRNLHFISAPIRLGAKE